ncbi:hypothetical protein LNKW23_19440 [Paralimibaculum aggregatum]|uniref:Ppx/GppA phosphatase N-terminal domain-containing protein n=1 Tax=Paralimibaculum aggregatum TaxID=3036245 RepID=A0ABQ6LQ55_9RHOB|nr:Ppx/GppA phosphatase family protein [Limibaculum sp. NKW23]GMG82731.1 hypothetical protein LNKW23_19440 [Limibaculum sp. NKW23]
MTDQDATGSGDAGRSGGGTGRREARCGDDPGPAPGGAAEAGGNPGRKPQRNGRHPGDTPDDRSNAGQPDGGQPDGGQKNGDRRNGRNGHGQAAQPGQPAGNGKGANGNGKAGSNGQGGNGANGQAGNGANGQAGNGASGQGGNGASGQGSNGANGQGGNGSNGQGGNSGNGQGQNRRPRSRNGGQRRHPGPTFAALDLGTNNCRLLIARPSGQEFEVIDAFSRAVRLGEGVEGTNRLSDEAQDRAVKALKICASKIRFHRARFQRNIATEACRRATNAQGFLDRVVRETGIRLDVITPEEEARLAVAGCAPLIDPRAEQLLVYDIGGGSTELIWIDLSEVEPGNRRVVVRGLSPVGGVMRAPVGARVTDWISLPMGVSTLGDRFAAIHDERARFKAMAAYVEAAMSRFAPFSATDRIARTRRLQIIGVSGTATTFGAIHLGLRSYNRSRVDGLWIPREAVLRVSDRLLDMGLNGRAAHPGIGRGRAGLVLAGAAILMTILRAWPVPRMRIADRGLREGMLYGLLQQTRTIAAE